MPHTINGSINSAVWLEYSTNGGTSYTRLPTSFPIGTSIVTDLLPINVDLKIRLIALCDESKISNVVDYDYVPPITSYSHRLSLSSSPNFIEVCTYLDLVLDLWAAESNIFSVTYFFTDSALTIPFNGENKFRKWTNGVISNTFQIGIDGQVLTYENC
jgi:hypothetical protein